MWLKEPSAGSLKNGLRAEDQVTAVFALKFDSSAVKKFEANLLDISNPKSPRYGQWLKVLLSFHFIYIY